MILTEEEAKKRACCGPPMIASIIAISSGIPIKGDGYYCIGSQCMAWRVRLELRGMTETVVKGYCGLAGGPDGGPTWDTSSDVVMSR